MQLPGVRTRAAGCLPSPALRTPSQGCCQQGLSLPELKNISKSLLELGLEYWASVVPQFCAPGRAGPQGLSWMGITIGRARHLGPAGMFLTRSCLLVTAPASFPISSYLISLTLILSRPTITPCPQHAVLCHRLCPHAGYEQGKSQPQLPGLVLLVPQVQQC